jgi:hypothetical protein
VCRSLSRHFYCPRRRDKRPSAIGSFGHFADSRLSRAAGSNRWRIQPVERLWVKTKEELE